MKKGYVVGVIDIKQKIDTINNCMVISLKIFKMEKFLEKIIVKEIDEEIKYWKIFIIVEEIELVVNIFSLKILDLDGFFRVFY